jgi:hypothetical protein
MLFCGGAVGESGLMRVPIMLEVASARESSGGSNSWTWQELEQVLPAKDDFHKRPRAAGLLKEVEGVEQDQETKAFH